MKSSFNSLSSKVDALQKLTGRWMDRLTRYATEGNPANENMLHILNAIHNLPDYLMKAIRLLHNMKLNL